MSDGAGNGQGDTGAGDGDKGGGDSFLGTIQNEELRGNENLKDFQDVDTLAQSYVDMKGAMPIVPENAEGYKVEIPEGVEINQEQSDAFKTLALDQKMTNEQYEAVLQFDFARQQKFVEDLTTAHNEAVTELKKEYGDKYDENLALAQKVLNAFNAKHLADRVDLGNDPDLFRFLTEIGGAISEDRLNAGGEQGGDDDPRPKTEDGKPMLTFKGMD